MKQPYYYVYDELVKYWLKTVDYPDMKEFYSILMNLPYYELLKIFNDRDVDISVKILIKCFVNGHMDKIIDDTFFR